MSLSRVTALGLGCVAHFPQKGNQGLVLLWQTSERAPHTQLQPADLLDGMGEFGVSCPALTHSSFRTNLMFSAQLIPFAQASF